MAEENEKAPRQAQSKSKIAEREEEILKFWQENKIFEKSLEKPAPRGEFVFYDGPPFATGLPHYGHLLASTIKDVVPRYKTMRGFKVQRKWGWDCHGLPVENLIEKELGLSSKRDIEKFGVKKFNEAAKNAVMRYANEWKKIIPRAGRWVDMENDYKTMDTTYTESVWWAFKNLYDKRLVYKSFKAMHLCPHCETTLSNFEVNQGYKDITDISVYVKFKVVGEDNTFFLAWTTTPWTLPGNVALAVNKDVMYAKVKKDGQFLIMAESLLQKVLNDKTEIIRTFSGKEILGKSYEPLFDYYKDVNIENKKNGWKVYHGDFVTIEDGTGIVHIAPAFGEEDMELGKAENLPFIQHVNIDGTFKDEVVDFAGRKVKPKENPQEADVEILKFLARTGNLFEKEKFTHSYPHCWRCDTPLLNFATTSWFVKVSDLKDKLVKENEKISWTPKEIGENRFGKWLLGARDWAISRSRYWGAPLPVWQDENRKNFVVGSIDDLKKFIKKSGNKYFAMRHGEAEQNVNDLVNADHKKVFHLTEEGRNQVKIAAQDIKSKKIDLIISSPFERCKETARIVAETVGLSFDSIILDDRISELKTGIGYEGKTWKDYLEFFQNFDERFEKAPEGGETLSDLTRRAGDFIYDLENKYSGKNILFVSHEAVITAVYTVAIGADIKLAKKIKKDKKYKPRFAEFGEIDFIPLPHNDNYEIDLHRPFIDEIELIDEDGKPLKRIPEVFDCWFESGSMPYAQFHYPFENKKELEEKFYPADFIAEGLDQTRGWFYTLLVLGTGLFDKSPYEKVIVNGLILAEDGKKMSKSLNNYPDLMYIIDKYGADSLRYYLMSSPSVKAEDLNFSEKGVDEISKKVVLKLENILSFYSMFTDINIPVKIKSENVLDKWIFRRTKKLFDEITESLDKYKLDGGARPILDFVDDLSVWYLRRSRDRFKSEDLAEKRDALATTRFVLLALSKYMAPFMPFFAENIYLKLKSENDPESVHLCEWFIPSAIEKLEEKETGEILENMTEVRKIVSFALEKRMTAGIKVRQPLNELTIKDCTLRGKEEYLNLIKDEVNVKSISFDEKLEEEVKLDTKITPELQKEGNTRDFVREIQELRKAKNLVPSDVVELMLETGEKGKEFIISVSEEIKKPTNISEIKFQNNNGKEILIGEIKFKFEIK